ncbi:hypothetical protein B484DRAFT_401433 [Ochromonadaceae sp. CCMP2298]|nr:hypothetical protein B484DRAFT_401433 [Ochromonadaceae sp. CCMP2298]
MSTNNKPKSNRGWEKPSAQTAESQIGAFVDGLAENEKQAHRTAFLHLMQSMAGTKVSAELTDGRTMTGILHTVTPFQGKPNIVVIKSSRIYEV